MQTKFKGIKKSIKIIIIVLASLVLLMAIPAVLLQFSRVQSAVVHLVTEHLSDNFNTKIDIRKVDYRFFNKLTIEGIYVEDQQQDTLCHVHKLYTGFDFFRLIKGKIAFSDIIIEQLNAHIKTDLAGNANYDFLLQTQDEKKPTSIDLKLDNFELIDSKISYSELDDLNAEHAKVLHRLSFKDFNTQLVIKSLTNDTIHANIKRLNTKEISGFEISNISASIIGSFTQISCPNLNISLPHSEINLDKIFVAIDNSEGANDKFTLRIPIKNTHITLSDLGGLIPELKNLHQEVRLNALINGSPSNFNMKNLRANYGTHSAIQGDLEIKDFGNLSQTHVQGSINKLQISTYELQDLIAKIEAKPFVFPQEVHRLGNVSFKGNINGFLNNLITSGNFTTNIGSITTNAAIGFSNQFDDFSFNGSVKTGHLNLAKLLDNDKLGSIAFRVDTKGNKKKNQAMQGEITGLLSHFELNQYSYNNAEFDGEFDGTGFNGKFNIKDDNIDASFLGIIDFNDPNLPAFDFDLQLNHADLHALHLTEDFPNASLSFQGISKLTGNHLDNLNGMLILQDINFTNNHQTLNIDDFIFTSRTGDNYNFLSVKSDYLNGSVSGDFKYSTILQTFNKLLASYLPAINTNNLKTHLPNQLNIDLKLDNSAELCKILDLSYLISGTSNLQGSINEATDNVDISAKIDTISMKKQRFENVSVQLNNPKKQLQLVGRTQLINQFEDVLNIFLSAEASNDNVDTRLMWQNNKEVTNAGEIKAKAALEKQNKSLMIHAQIEPTEVIISDSIWHMRASQIHYYADSLLTVDHFLFENEEQFIHIDGSSSENPQDSLMVRMNDLNLDYVMNLVRLQGVSFGGFISGDLKLFNLMKEPIILGELFAEDFSINDALIADAYLTSTWDKENSRLIINGDFENKKEEKVAQAVGYFVPQTDSLDIQIQATKFPLDFLNPYFEGVASNFSGNASGDVRISGPTKALLFEADAKVTEGTVKVDILNTTYYFDDKVILTPYSIQLSRIKIRDKDKNEATLTGRINHDGSFQDMTYDVVVNSKKILGLNTTSMDDDFFYGKAYVGGLVKIFGNDQEANIIINGNTQAGTKCFMSMGAASTALESDFITFIERLRKPYQDDNYRGNGVATQSPFNVKLDMQIEVTPDAEMDILVDTQAGDKITGRGNGNIRIKFDSFSDVELYGTIELEQGYYLFTLQTVIRKEFRVHEGSTLTWSGDPFSAQVNITGYYPLTASLADLIESDELRQITSRSTVPVHCILHLTDNLMSPNIQFDIDLPSSDESVKSRVKNIINTEEMMNRQILYLILFHKFFTPENIRTAAVGVNEGLSLAMASGSAQINSYLQSWLNSDVVSLGFDWQKADVESDEVKAQILIQPNNRLVINGNIGYRNDNISENKFIGDFDLEYKLVESGRLRFTAYNHTIDRAQLREAKTTQGVGLMYREDFNSVSEMFVYYWDLMKRVFKKKEKEATAVQLTD